MSPRPTREHLAHTLALVEALAYDPRAERDYHLVARIAWAVHDRHAEQVEAEQAAAYGPGSPAGPEHLFPFL